MNTCSKGIVVLQFCSRAELIDDSSSSSNRLALPQAGLQLGRSEAPKGLLPELLQASLGKVIVGSSSSRLALSVSPASKLAACSLLDQKSLEAPSHRTLPGLAGQERSSQRPPGAGGLCCSHWSEAQVGRYK